MQVSVSPDSAPLHGIGFQNAEGLTRALNRGTNLLCPVCNAGESLLMHLIGQPGLPVISTRVPRNGLLWASIVIQLFWAAYCPGYSLLTHEQIVDITWKDDIQPLLQKRFTQATPEDLLKAHAYAYGGCLIQDIGYYPFGSHFFSDLTHYVRSGDFVVNLLRNSTNLNEYAFALGALAHYASDISAHPSVNRAVALSFPKLRAKYGDSVTYAQNPKSHMQVEFGFDLTQVAKNRYTSDRYHDFIGFEVSTPVLERAVLDTYGISLADSLGSVDLAVGTFRRSVSHVIPQMTRVALIAYRPELVRDIPNFSENKFLYNLSRSQYEKEWGKGYRKPGFGARALAFFLRIIPKVGPAKALAFKIPTPDTEDLYVRSVNRSVDKFRDLLHELQKGHLALSNLDFDTANPPRAGEYPPADESYGRLINELVKHDLDNVHPDLRDNILSFYSHGPPTQKSSKERKQWCKTADALWTLNCNKINSTTAKQVER